MANEILPFGLGAESNVMTQAEYEALAARSGGFSSGVAKSEQLNKVWRQSSFIASVLADFIATQSGDDVLDNGNTAALLASLELAIKKYANSNLPIASTSKQGITQLSNLINSSSETLAATLKAVKTVSDAGLKVTGNLAEIKAAGSAAVAEAQANLNLAELLGDALQKANNLSEIKDAGPAAVAQTLLNLGLGDAAKKGIATNAEMAAGTSTSLLPTVAAVMSLFSKRAFTSHDYIRIPDVLGGLIIQWGFTPNLLTNTIGVANWSHPLPIPFPTACIVGTTTTASTTSPLTSAANLSGIPSVSGPVSTITGSVQNARNDQSVAIYYIAIGY
ncbi:bacteriophage tail fiber protein [Yersinia pseudotuberculosis]|uniref:phage tail protein n=1 Tax=Yersinia pseudotuberculosis TaxID=633 RepID=UPI0004F8BF5A|nr:phage tail protein [Yersinia pseudotuberculosis]AIN14343.1 phage tail fiber repeat family protein [Yersinia pseudotuberculosis]AJJ05691.1 phage tail fiber repeat family protein [Yersinia pseudotuberculosis]MBO1563292.1 hypothetical protein [Yersinia pseudotuberculosis]CNK77844.1 bacteriophage tail fiber protein [Yersinia pseudotuberculosis]SUQ17431.1 bacteriophage tail fiber protein [Yersinia pseudotuberculosis]